MIPVIGGQTLEVKNQPKGISVTLKYLIDHDRQLKYHRIQNEETLTILRLREIAIDKIPTLPADKITGDEEKDRQVLDELRMVEYLRLRAERARTNHELELDRINDLIDIFVVGWSGQNLPPFPGDGVNPSSVLMYMPKMIISRIVSDSMPTLVGMSEDESKNSSPPRSATSTSRRRTATTAHGAGPKVEKENGVA